MKTRFGLLAMAVIANLSCGDSEPLTAPAQESLRPDLEIVDGVQGAGHPHFFFLPPIVAPPSTDGDFDDSVLPLLSVQVCEWSEGACLLPPVAEFTEPDLKLDLEGEAYFVNWKTSDSDVREGSVYRIRVLISGAELGHADVQLVAGNQLKNVDSDEFVPLTGNRSLQIRFRVEHGVGIVIDARALSVGTLRLNGTGETFPTQNVQEFVLVPGLYGLSYGAGFGAGIVKFSVLSDGTVDFDPTLDGILDGRGTTTLLVNGASLTIDATALTVATLYLRGVVGYEVGGFPTSSPLPVTLLPGRHDMTYPAGFGAGIVEFSVSSDGTVDFDPTLDGILDGRGTATLLVRGAEITVDATASGSPTFDLLGVGVFSSSVVQPVRLLPGVHNYYTSLLAFEFSVLAGGLIDFDPALEPQVAGRGTSNLTVVF